MVIKIPMNESSSDVFMTSKEYSDCANIFKNTLNKYGLKKYSIEKYNDSKKLYEEILRDELKQSSNPRWIEFIFVSVNTEDADINKKKECYKELKENLKAFGSRFKYFGINAMKNDGSDDFYIRFMKSKPVSESYIDEWDQDILMENCINEQVLQEMNFSKKDLQDPATIDKILKRKGVFEDIIKYTTWLFAALNVVAGIVVKIELKKHDMSEAGAIGFGVFAVLELILVKIHELVGKLPAKAYEKNMEKYKKQIRDLIEKMKKKIQEDPDNANEYKKIIKNCEAVLAEIDKREKTAKKQELRIKVRYVERCYNTLKRWWDKPHCFDFNDGEAFYNEYSHPGIYCLNLAKEYGISEKQIIDRALLIDDESDKGYCDPENIYEYVAQWLSDDTDNEADELKKKFNNSKIHLYYMPDEWPVKFIVVNQKKIYDIDWLKGKHYPELVQGSVFYDPDYKLDKEALIEFDKLQGFYKFSKCPDAVKQKDFLEELNKKSSVKENADMVIDVNPAPVNEETSEIKESVETSITEGFGIDKAQKASLSDLELSYDRKFNAFCLSVSSYSPEKLQNTLAQKQKVLSDAQKEKKDAKDRYAKLAAQLKIDYLKNTIDKTNALIKKKSKAIASTVPKKKAVSESVEVLNELFWKKKQQTKQDTKPKKTYAPLTKEEFDKCVKIFKNTINKYPLVKKWVEYKDPPECEYGCCSSYVDYLKYNGNGVYIALIDTDFIDEDDFDTWIDDHFGKFYYDDLVKEFEKLDFVELFKDTIGPVYCIGIKSDKLVESTNEGFFDKKPKAKLHEFTEAEMSKIMADAKSVLNQAKFKSFKPCVTLELETNKYYRGIIIGHINTSEAPFAYNCGPDKMFDELDKDKKEFAKDLKDKLVADKLCVDEVTCAMQIMVIPGKDEE